MLAVPLSPAMLNSAFVFPNLTERVCFCLLKHETHKIKLTDYQRVCFVAIKITKMSKIQILL